MKYALLFTAAMISLASPALADDIAPRLPATPEHHAHEAVIHDCVIEKAGGITAFGQTATSSVERHPTLRPVKSSDPHAPKFATVAGPRPNYPKVPPVVAERDVHNVTSNDMRKFAAQCRSEHP